MKYLDNLVIEKNLDLEHLFEVQGPSGTNLISLGVVIEHIEVASKYEQAKIRDTLVKIDFMNGDVCHFFKHLAGAIAA